MGTPGQDLDPAGAPGVLADCLDRIACGEPVDAVLAAVPDDRAAVAPLVRAALLARGARPLPDPAFRDRLGALLRTAELDAPEERGLGAREEHDRSRRHRAALRLIAMTAAVFMALGALATGAGASPAELVAGLRRASREALLGLVALDRGIAPAHVVEIPDVPRVARRDVAEPARAASGVRPDDARGAAPRDMERERPAGEGASAPSPSAPTAASALDPPPTARLATIAMPTPGPTVAGEAVAVEAAPAPAESTVEPEAPPGVIVAGEEATAVVSPPAPVIAPAPPAVIGGGGIAGTVTFVDETPFPGVLVTAYPLDRRGGVIWPWGVSARTEADGSYRIVRLFAGRYKVAVGERSPWVTRRWYLDTRNEHEAEPVEVFSGRFAEGIDVRTRVWPLSGPIVADPSSALRWLLWY